MSSISISDIHHNQGEIVDNPLDCNTYNTFCSIIENGFIEFYDREVLVEWAMKYNIVDVLQRINYGPDELYPEEFIDACNKKHIDMINYFMSLYSESSEDYQKMYEIAYAALNQ